MSSTDEDRLRRFFRGALTSAATRIRDRGVALFPRAPEAELATWYLESPNEPEFIEFEAESCDRLLRDRWEAQGFPELAELVDPLLELARHLELDEEQAADVSPFVYVMY